MDRDHAILSASSASKWLNCTPSAQLEEAIPDYDTPYSQEGTLAHEIAAIFLKGPVHPNAELEVLRMSPFWFKAMEGYCIDYVDFIDGEITHTIAEYEAIEKQVDYSAFAPDGFGTVDYLHLSEGVLRVFDFKFGKGVPVSAEENPQTRLYALGAVDMLIDLFDIQTVHIYIVQPRLENYTAETLSVKELLAWGDGYVKPRALKAWEGAGDLITGDWCQFCKNLPTCSAKAAEALEMAKYEFAEPSTLPVEDLAEIHEKASAISAWLNKVSDYIYKEAVGGKSIPGLKLVEGRSNRKWSDPDKVKAVLLEYFKEDEITNTKLKGLGDIGNLMSKDEFDERVGKYIIKPAGAPVLVPESDKRKELNSLAQAIKEFS